MSRELGLEATLKQCRGLPMPENYHKGFSHDASFIHEQLSRLTPVQRQATARMYSQHYTEEKRAAANNWLMKTAEKYADTNKGGVYKEW